MLSHYLGKVCLASSLLKCCIWGIRRRVKRWSVGLS